MEADQIMVIKGRRHQGEGKAGFGPRLHVLDDLGGIRCGAVPTGRSTKPRPFEAIYFVLAREIRFGGAPTPICRHCRKVIEASLRPMGV